MKRELKRELAALIYPVRCPVCGCVIGANDCFCAECTEILVPYTEKLDIPQSAGGIAAYEYREEMSQAIIIMKKGIGGNAPFAFGAAMEERIRAAGMTDAEYLIPVPMFREDLRARDYDQSLHIARELSIRLGIPVLRNAVEKYRRTLPQKELDREMRKVNLNGAFRLTNPESISGKTVIIVDDICTTGSTLAELTDVLIKGGAKKVYCACCCKTPQQTPEMR